MNFNRKILVLSILIIFICICAVYSSHDFQNNAENQVISNQTDNFGCCSVIIQLDGNDTILSYRRDANLTADIYIEKINWHGIPVIKQYKTEGGYFNHLIITDDGWVISLGGIDDGSDNQLCEDIASNMINDNNTISEYALAKIQKVKQPYKKGHFIIKAPNGNYGFATVDKIKTGKLEPGQYISMPNAYKYSRAGNISLDSSDKIKTAVDLALSDMFGISRRGIFTYYINSTDNGNLVDIYVSNDDGSYFETNYRNFIDNIYYNNTLINGEDIPIAPNYEKIGSVSFINETSNVSKLTLLIVIVTFVVLVGILFFVVLRFVRFIKFKIRRIIFNKFR